MIQLDHFIYVVPNLEEAQKMFEAQTGVLPKFGGQHLSIGTHNALG